MKQICNEIHEFLCNNKAINNEYSGCALCSVLLSGNRLFTTNVGTSRAILISLEDKKKISLFNVKQLTKDHSPEAEQRTPICLHDGLTMSRSLGDKFAHTLGCSSEPDITSHILRPQDKIIVIANEVIWQYLSNTEVANILYPYLIADQKAN